MEETMVGLICIKPLSVNECWQGKRYKTPKYKKYIQDLLFSLPRLHIDNVPLKVYYEFGVSSKLSDWDNPVKPFQDILQKKYKFDDKNIFEATVKKVLVAKGQEYIKFEIIYL